MKNAASRLSARAGELRHAFDSAFAEETRRDATPMENLLAFNIGPEAYALRLSQIAGLFTDRKITPFPSTAAALRGFVAVRGSIVPAYDLHHLLGHPAPAAPRWLAIAAGAPAAFVFETFVGHLSIPRDAIVPRDANAQASQFIQVFATAHGLVRPVVHLPSVLEAIRGQLSRSTEIGVIGHVQ